MILPQLPLIGYAVHVLETIRTSYVMGNEFRNNQVSSRVGNICNVYVCMYVCLFKLRQRFKEVF